MPFWYTAPLCQALRTPQSRTIWDMGGPLTVRILLPLAPEYIGYADVGLTDDMLVSRPAAIEELPEGLFKYHVRLAGLEAVPDVAETVSHRDRPPSGEIEELEPGVSRQLVDIVDASFERNKVAKDDSFQHLHRVAAGSRHTPQGARSRHGLRVIHVGAVW